LAKLYFYYSAMNAGKSTTLLQSDYNYRERGMHTLVFTPIIDVRLKAGVIHSRIGLQADAIPFDQNFNLFDYVADFLSEKGSKIDCLLLDEAQFLKKEQVIQLTDIADELNIPVLCYGLRSDFLAEPFEGSKYLLTLADELIEIKTICHCGRKAIMNIRIDEQNRPVKTGDQIEIGGNDRYVSLCRKHFKQGITGTEAPQAETASLEDAVS